MDRLTDLLSIGEDTDGNRACSILLVEYEERNTQRNPDRFTCDLYTTLKDKDEEKRGQRSTPQEEESNSTGCSSPCGMAGYHYGGIGVGSEVLRRRAIYSLKRQAELV